MTHQFLFALSAPILISGLFATPLFAHDNDKTDAPQVTQSYDLSGFSKIRIDGVYLVNVTQGETFSITTSGDEKEMEKSEVKLNGDTLILGSKKKSWSGNKGDRHGITTTITMPDLESIKINGVSEFTGDNLDLGDLDLDVNGVADMTLSGSCENLTAKINGVGDIDLKSLECETGDLSVNGAGEMSAHTSSSVKARVNGVGEMKIYGDPKTIDKKKTWLGSITMK